MFSAGKMFAETLALCVVWVVVTGLLLARFRRDPPPKQPLSELLTKLRVDLDTAAEERAKKGIPAYFKIESVELTVDVAQKDSASAEAAGLQVTHEATEGNKLVLKLTPLEIRSEGKAGGGHVPLTPPPASTATPSPAANWRKTP
jgi:hypothetical protein